MTSPHRHTSQNQDERVANADRLLSGLGESPSDPAAATKLYLEAAAAGSGVAAMRLAVLAAVGVAREANWSEALDHLADAAELNHEGAQRQLMVLSDGPDERKAAASSSDWRKLRNDLDLKTLLTPPAIKNISSKPAIMTIEALASEAMCRWIIAQGRGRLERGLINDLATGQPVPDPIRTALGAPFSITQADIVTVLVQERLARATRLMVRQQEAPYLLSYEPGQQYRPHFDFFDPSNPAFQPQLALMGQRVATCLTYLNDEYEGGETDFPRVGWRYRGKPGDALLFLNVTPDRRPDPLTLHAGLPVTRGRKWLLSQWVRDRVQPIL